MKVKEIRELYKNKKLIVPKIQRSLIWKQEDKENLLDSLINEYPIGAITLFKNKIDDTYWILDGLQRTTTILELVDKKLEHLKKDTFIDLFTNVQKEYSVEHPDYKEITQDHMKIIYDILLKVKGEDYDSSASKNAQNLEKILKENPISEVITVNPHLLTRFFEELSKKLPNEDTNLTIIEFEGTEEQAAKVFEVVNITGKKLSELEILAARWGRWQIPNNKVNDDFIKSIKNKFEKVTSVLEDSIQIETTEYINPFEIIYGIINRFIDGVKKSKQRNIFEHIFYDPNENSIINIDLSLNIFKHLFSKTSIGSDNSKLGKIIYEIMLNNSNSIELINSIIKELINTSEEISNMLPILRFKGNSKTKLTKPQVSKALLTSLLSYYISKKRNFITINEKDNIKIDESPVKISSYELKQQLIYHSLRHEMSSASSIKAYNNLTNKIYDEVIDKDMFKSQLNSIFKNQKYNKKQIQFNDDTKLIMFEVYHGIMSFEEVEGEEFHHLDHFVPKSLLQKEMGVMGIASFANMAIFSETKNKRKSSKLGLEFLEMDKLFCKFEKDEQKEIRSAYTSIINEYKKTDQISQDLYNIFLDKRYSAIENYLVNKLYK